MNQSNQSNQSNPSNQSPITYSNLINLICPVTSLIWGTIPSPTCLVGSIYIDSIHPLLILNRKQSKNLLLSPSFHDLPNEESNLIAISYLIASASSKVEEFNKEKNHSLRSDFLILNGKLSTNFIKSSPWARLNLHSLITCGEILFTQLNSTINSKGNKGKQKTLRDYLPTRIYINDNNIQNIPSIINEASISLSSTIDKLAQANMERELDSLISHRDTTLSLNSRLRDTLPSKGALYIIELIESTHGELPQTFKDEVIKLLITPSIPDTLSTADIRKAIELLDSTDSTFKIKFIALNLLDKKLSKLTNSSLLASLGLDDEDSTTLSSGISYASAKSFLEVLNTGRNDKPQFKMVSTDAKPTMESNSEFDLNLNTPTSPMDKPQSSSRAGTQQSIQASLAKLKAFLKK